MPITTHEQWLEKGVSRTVYSLPYPEADALIRARLESPDALIARHARPWENSQDRMHEGFMRSWLDFAAKANVHIGAGPSRHFYPCAGASEAIRETLALIGSKKASLVVFDGEYEGFEAVAQGLGMKVAKIQRARWRDELPALWDKGYELFLSNPSSIDGMHWRDLEECIQLADVRGGRIHLDLSYVGTCESAMPMDIKGESISTVIFSLSKPFGVYYRRIGGCFSREPNPLLYGNLWFKNLDSLALGEALLKAFAPGQLPRAWAHQRKAAMEAISAEQGWTLLPSDVFMLARGEGRGLEELARAPGFPARVCLTPRIGALIERSR